MKKSKKKIIIIIAIIVVLLILIISVVSCTSKAVSEIAMYDSGVLVEPLSEHDLSTSISVSGKVESQEKTSVTSDLTYKINELNVSVGDYVNEGDVLCVFDSTDLQAQIKTLEDQLQNASSLISKQKSINERTLSQAKEEKTAQLEAAQNNINNAKSRYDNAVSNKSQLEAAYNSCQKQITEISYNMEIIREQEDKSANYISLQEQLSSLTVSSSELLSQMQAADEAISSARQVLDEANSNYKSIEKAANQQIQAAQDTIDTQTFSSDNDEAKKELDSLKRKLDKITVKAEHSGIITSLNVANGSIHAGGELMTIQNTNALKLTVSIKENDILNVKKDMKAIVTSNANDSIEVEGTVTKVVDFISSSTDAEGTVTAGYSAEISLPDNCGMLLGMSANAKILISDEETTLSVAYDSIFKEDDNSYIYKAVPAKDGQYKVEKIQVTTGTDSNYYTAISSDELEKDDYIICYPDTVSEGDLIDIDETYMSAEDGE